MGVPDMPPELRDAILANLERHAPVANAAALAQRYAALPNSGKFGNTTLTHLQLWLGDYDGVGDSDDRVTTTIVAWDRYPPAFRNSPGMKRKLERVGVPAWWRAHGYPLQCHAVGAKDFNCD